jgi:hypothetical protein
MWHFKRQTPMTRKLFILNLILTICFTSCGQTKSSNENQQPLRIDNDSSIIVILPFDTTQHWIFKDNKPADLTTEDLQNIEKILIKCINTYNPEKEKQLKEIYDKHPEYKLNKKNFIIDITRYKRQYIATVNSKGQKEIWINCFCNTHNLNWRKQIISVRDGGNCYFNLKVNLTTRQYYELMVNGDA